MSITYLILKKTYKKIISQNLILFVTIHFAYFTYQLVSNLKYELFLAYLILNYNKNHNLTKLI